MSRSKKIRVDKFELETKFPQVTLANNEGVITFGCIVCQDRDTPVLLVSNFIRGD